MRPTGIAITKDRLVQEGYDGRITFTLDDDGGGTVELYKDINKLRLVNPDLGKYVGAVCFADDEFYVPLQASDMLANLTYKWFLDRANGAGADVIPNPLKSLIFDPATGLSMDIHSEFWDVNELDRAGQEIMQVSSPMKGKP